MNHFSLFVCQLLHMFDFRCVSRDSLLVESLYAGIGFYSIDGKRIFFSFYDKFQCKEETLHTIYVFRILLRF